jgi:hypothetical protein
MADTLKQIAERLVDDYAHCDGVDDCGHCADQTRAILSALQSLAQPAAHDYADDPKQSLARERDSLLAELRNIADADPSKWEPDVRDQFQQWAQNRARTAARLSVQEPRGQEGE